MIIDVQMPLAEFLERLGCVFDDVTPDDHEITAVECSPYSYRDVKISIRPIPKDEPAEPALDADLAAAA